MTTATLSRWGNAVGIRIPSSYCRQLGFAVGDKLSLRLKGSELVVEKPDEEYTLQARMAAWDGERLQEEEFDWGAPAGKEAW